MCDAEAKTGSAAGTRQAAAPGVPNSKLAGEGKGHINAAWGECLSETEYVNLVFIGIVLTFAFIFWM